MRTKLTAKAVERHKAPTKTGKQALIWDTELKGFGLLLSGKTSSKTFIVQRDLPGGKTRRVTIGSVAEIDLAKAREEAAGIIHSMRQGHDPKHKSAGDITLREALEAYLAARTDLRTRSVDSYRYNLERYLEPWLDRALKTISREDVEEKHKAIAASVAKSGRFKGEAAANGVMRIFRAVCTYQVERGLLPADPVKLARQWYDVPRRERLVKADELPKFYEAAAKLPNPIQSAYLLFLLFTGMRRSEAARLRWDDVDFAGKLIRVPRASAKGKRKLDLPMVTFVHDLLVARRGVGRSEYVFPADSKTGHLSEPKYPLKLVADATGIRVSVHDLRRTYTTIAESSDISPIALYVLTNHSLGKDVTSGYILMTTDRLRAPAQKVCDKLLELCQVPAPAGENVEQLHG